MENVANLTQEINKKIVYNKDKKAVGLAPEFPIYSLPESERVTEIKDEEVKKYQQKAQEWIIRGGNKLTVVPQ